MKFVQFSNPSGKRCVIDIDRVAFYRETRADGQTYIGLGDNNQGVLQVDFSEFNEIMCQREAELSGEDD